MRAPTTRTGRAPEWLKAEPFVAAAMRGDATAWDPIVRLVQRHVRAYVAATSHDLERHVDDMAQEVFVRAFLNVQKLRDPVAFQKWLLTIAHNVVMDTAKAEGRLPLADEQVEEVPSQTADADVTLIDRVVLNAGLAAINREYAAVLVLLFLYGMSYADAAEVLGCDVGTISSRRSRGLAALRALYGVPGSELDG